jgi:hypothetical protein
VTAVAQSPSSFAPTSWPRRESVPPLLAGLEGRERKAQQSLGQRDQAASSASFIDLTLDLLLVTAGPRDNRWMAEESPTLERIRPRQPGPACGKPGGEA